jgi:hypothetical protein
MTSTKSTKSNAAPVIIEEDVIRGAGRNALSTNAEVVKRCRALLREGVTTKGGQMRTLRERGQGVNEKRFTKLCGDIILAAQEKAEAKAEAKATPAKRTRKAA